MLAGRFRGPIITAVLLGAGIWVVHAVTDRLFLPAANAGNNAAPVQPSPEPQEKLAQHDREAFEKISDSAQKINDMILLIVAGSLAVLVGSNYVHPMMHLRWLYVLFPLGWSFFAASIDQGLEVRSTFLAYLVSPGGGTRADWVQTLNTGLILQVRHFQFGLISFAVWLLVYVSWWITRSPVPSE